MKRVQNTPMLWLVLIQFMLAYQWLSSALTKFSQPEFMSNIGSIMQLMVSKTHFSWYGSFLASVDARFWGNIVRFSELTIGVGLLVGGLYVLRARRWQRGLIYVLAVALCAGALLNLNFYLAASWDSKAVGSLNVMMGITQIILGVHYLRTLKR